MELKNILNADVQLFINENLTADLHSLLLKKSPFPAVSMQEIVQQIHGKKVAMKKFPFLLKEGIIFPPNINLEQSSSELVAKYKAALAKGKKFADLTCGFGIDAWFISQNFSEITLVERNSELLEIVKNNWKILGKHAVFVNENLQDFISKNSENFDLIYLDPARRDFAQKKVFLLEDLSPNLLEIQVDLLKISNQILIKLSPLIDISYLVCTLKNIAEIHILAVKNDVKEVLVLINADNTTEKISVSCINLETDDAPFTFYFDEIKYSQSEFSEALQFIYLPNNAVLKSGAFNLVSERFGLKKLHQNTQIFTSDQKIKNFPGRILEVEKITAKELKKNDQYNIISKNYPLKPEEIRKKYALKDGGNRYLVFTEDASGKTILKSK